jgi:predicted transcriptional regulator
MNKEKLRSVMALHGDTNKDIAELLEISEQSVSAKINENNTEFKQGEIAKIKGKYNLTPEEVDEIFFNDNGLFETQKELTQ